MKFLPLTFFLALVLDSASSFQQGKTYSKVIPVESSSPPNLPAVSRREWLVGGAAAVAFSSMAAPAFADDQVTLPKLEMKDFVDPQGLFSIRVPQSFFTLRRTQKGDLPDAKTGKGRRGSSIFTAGNMAKAEVVAVERYVHNKN